MEKRIYSCATAHLDTIWNWTLEHSIGNCLYNTLAQNFALFEKYPDYTFNFEGAYRYELLEEYYPREFERLKQYIEEGRWCVTGSAYENGDVNVPSPEALFRNILLGNGYFKKKFGKESKEIYLPDCFGFGWALPSVIAHANLLGFTTQKLTWGSAYGTPFDIGKWYGVNGAYCFAAVRPDAYDLTYSAVRTKKDNVKKLKENEAKYGLPWTFSFHGVGDQGGAPKESSVAVLQKEIRENKTEEVQVLSAPSDQIYRDLDALSEAQKDRLPSWKNELVMRDHGAGGYTSRAIGKRLNRACEELAYRAEAASVTASLLGGMDYPQAVLNTAWKRAIAHQFHDDLPGTSVQRAYKRSWNDYVLSLNQFETTYETALGVVASAMQTDWAHGMPIVVHNSNETERTSLVKIRVPLRAGQYLYAKDRNGKYYPVQVLDRQNNMAEAVFSCTVPALGYKAFDLRTSDTLPVPMPNVTASRHTIENALCRVSLNENGEIAQIFDKRFQRNLLKSAVREELIPYAGSTMWPAWELTYRAICSGKKHYPRVKSVRVLYEGAVTAAVEVVKTYGNSTFKSVISLEADSPLVRVENHVDWWEQRTLFKQSFPLAVSNPTASYDLGLGIIQRTNNRKEIFEVPAQKWADISKKGFGVSVYSDSKYGWDKPADNNLRLTILHSPKRNFHIDSMQSVMDLGRNDYGYALSAHGEGLAETQRTAKDYQQPFAAVLTDKHKGTLGSSYAFGKLNKENVLLRAVKRAEDSDEIVVRFNESANEKTENIRFKLGEGIESAREIYASEETLDEATVTNGTLIFDLAPYEVKSFALKLKPLSASAKPKQGTEIRLKGNTTLFTARDFSQKPVIRDYHGLTLPKELHPETISCKGLIFALDAEQAVRCKGGKLFLGGKYKKLSLLLLLGGEDKNCTFKLDGKPVVRTVYSSLDAMGQWDLVGMRETACIKPATLAYEFTHAHSEKNADILAKQVFVYLYEFDVTGVREFTLPNDRDLLLLSAAAETEPRTEKLLYPMYARIESRPFQNKMTQKNKARLVLGLLPHNTSPRAHLNARADHYKIK